MKIAMLLSVLFLAGCHFSDAVKEARTPNADGVTPIGLLLRDIPRVVAGDPTAFVSVATTIVGLAITAMFGHKSGVRNERKRAKAASIPAPARP